MNHCATVPTAPPTSSPAASGTRKLFMVGNPNVGKSVTFALLTGKYVTVSNYPGTTVEVCRGNGVVDGTAYQVVDTPGTNNLIPLTDDEAVTRDLLLEEQPEVVLQVVDTKNLRRGLLLTVQLAEAGMPFLVTLNMQDEARSRGIKHDVEGLARCLGVPVVPCTAVRREGLSHLLQAIGEVHPSAFRVEYDVLIEDGLDRLEPYLPDAPLSKRALGLMVLAQDESLEPWLIGKVDASAWMEIQRIRDEVTARFNEPLYYLINQRRLEIADSLVQEFQTRERRREGQFQRWLGRVTMHPVWGLACAGFILYLTYLIVGVFAAGDVVDKLENGLFGGSAELINLPGKEAGVPATDLFLSTGSGVLQAKAPDGSLFGSAALPQAGADAEGLAIQATWDTGTQLPDGRWQYRLSLSGQEVAGGEASASEHSFQIYPEPGVSVEALPSDSRAQSFLLTAPPGGGAVGRVRAWDGYLNHWVSDAVQRFLPWAFLQRMLVGEMGMITVGLTYALALILPIIFFFFIIFGFLEDSGYLPRLAVMVNRLFKGMGLNGRAVLPMVLGLGCDTMATVTTRTLATRKEKLITTILLALAVPCSAQLAVIGAQAGRVSGNAFLLFTGIILGVLFLVGYLASKIIPGESSDFILELPPIRLPKIQNILVKTFARLRWYLEEAVPLFLLGTLVLFLLKEAGVLEYFITALEPLTVQWLGLPRETAAAFVLGFLRRDYAAALAVESSLLTPVQVLVALVTITLFMPCIANFFMMVKERGMKQAVAIVAFIFPFAFFAGGVLHFTLDALHVDLNPLHKAQVVATPQPPEVSALQARIPSLEELR